MLRKTKEQKIVKKKDNGQKCDLYLGIIDRLWWLSMLSLKKTAENATSDGKQFNLMLKCLVKFAMTKLQLTNHVYCCMEQMHLGKTL